MALSVNEPLLSLNPDDGWLQHVRYCPSAHYDQRPEGTNISLLVIHGISLPPGEFGGTFIDDLFTGRLDSKAHSFFASIAHLRVSAHALIRRDGEIVQYVSFLHRAWHAGVSNFLGRESCNDFSIGIELEGCDEVPYTDVQYQQLVKLIGVLQQAWPLLRDEHLVGHCDIAPGRKTDPGQAFDWQRLRTMLQHSVSQNTNPLPDIQ